METNKTSEFLVYICSKMSTCDNFGAVLLNKTLYYTDATSFLKLGKPISDFKYIKQAMGPTPDPAQFLSLKRDLIEANRLVEEPKDYFGKILKKLIAIDEPNVEYFSSKEIKLIDETIDLLKDLSASDVSEISHREISWQVAELKEELPFYTYLLTEEEPDDSDLEWAGEIIAKCQTSGR